nr:MAG TPA: Baseplate wedge protein [Caudoviricetes sp.]
MNLFDWFKRSFGKNGDRQDWTADEYQAGWAAINNDPPTVEQFNQLQFLADEKAAYLFAQMAATWTKDKTPLTVGDNERLKRAIQLMITEAAASVVDNLTSNAGDAALSANQGRILNERIMKAVPSGSILYTASTAVPDGWLLCNGLAVPRDEYPDLFAAIGTTYGSGNGATTFNLPDIRGEFIRALDNGRGIDANRRIGTYQADEIKSHKHITYFGEGSMQYPNGVAATGQLGSGGGVDRDNSFPYTSNTGGEETRPRNIAFPAIIKI